jgi:hypothetical protein
MKRAILLLVLLLVPALPAAAQVHGGSVNGTVRDQSAAVLPGATVTAQGIDFTKSIQTTEDGSYHLLDLAPGSYKITASLNGFATAVRDAVIVSVGRDVDVSFTLGVGNLSDTVTVDAPAPVVNATPVGTAVNFTNDELQYIPTSRDPFGIIRAVPGVLSDKLNTSGGETGQQLLVGAKGARQQDTSWTLDGVEITDMGAAGQSATYFNFDNFDEIHVSTAGNDIRSRTGALNIDLSVKRGGNKFHGGLRGYFANTRGLQAGNIPPELLALATPVTDKTSDHLTRSSDWGFDIGGPLLRDRAWFYGSFSEQRVGVFRRTSKAVDETTLRDPNVKINAQATKKDLVNFLWYNGYKIKDNRAPGAATFEQAAATWHQDNYYSDSPLHGLFKIADDRIFNPHLLASAKYAYFNTGIALTPEGGMAAQAVRNVAASTTSGSTFRNLSARPQHTGTIDLNSFFSAFGATHDVKFGGGFRTVDVFTEQMYPGNGILSLIQTTTDLRAQVYREGHGGNRADYLDFYIGDTISKSRATVDVALRYDRQWGYQDASTSQANPLFPTLLPGIDFPGGRAPFTWKNFSPRAGISYALDSAGKTVARVNYSRFPGQLLTTAVGYTNVAANLGSITYRWTDLDGNGSVSSAAEVNTASQIGNAAGINASNPSLPISPSVIDPGLKAPITQGIVAGIERELLGGLAVSASYTYNRTTNLYGNQAVNITNRVGVNVTDFTSGGSLTVGKPTGGSQVFTGTYTGTLPDGASFSIPIYNINGAKFTASGGGFVLATVPGYFVDYNGVEVGLTKRLSHRWMGRLSFGYNNAREHFTDAAGRIDNNGNPMATVTEPLVEGGQYIGATSATSPGYYANAKWQVNVDGMFQAPYGIELAGNVFGRQGYPMPVYATSGVNSTTAATVETLRLLVTPTVDYFRYPNVWDTDARVARAFKFQTINARVMLDVFNLFNANTALLRNNDITSSTFNALSQNMTPRLVRFGVTLGF